MNIITRLATGFIQPKRRSNGMDDARDAILTADPAADVQLYKWHDDVNTIAFQLSRECVAGTRLVFAGHSWGVWFLVRLAKQLRILKVSVRVLLSADGVCRPPGSPLLVPSNVAEIQSWYQTRGKIHGSQIIATAATKHEVHQQVHVGHARVDETPAFQAALLEFATGGKQL